MKKRGLMLIVAILIVFSLAACGNAPEPEPEFRQICLMDFNSRYGTSNWRGWYTDGFLDTEAPHYPASDFNLARTLVVEFSEPPRGAVYLNWSGEGNNHIWFSPDIIIPENSGETRFEINLRETFGRYFEGFDTSTETRIYLAYFGYEDENGNQVNGDMDDIIPLITNIYFILEEKN